MVANRISACMLGKLRMPIDKAIEEYVKLMKDVFSEKKLSPSGSITHKTNKLRQALGLMIREATGNEEEMMLGAQGDDEKCKTAVFAMAKKNMNACLPVLLRSYRVDVDPSPDCTIRDALHATMAHPDLFKSIDIGELGLKRSFVGGEIGCSNPIVHVLSEVKRLYPDRHVACILSVGAGHARTIQVPDPSPLQRIFRTRDVVVMKQMVTDGERVAEEMEARFKATSEVYFRFNVDQGMQSMLPGCWEQLAEVSEHTKCYLHKPTIERNIEQAIQSIGGRRATIETKFIDGEIPGRVIKRPAKLKRCPAPTPIYTGRDTESGRLETCLTKSDDERCICVVYGLGGVGKTQLALNAIERTRDKWDCVIYVDAASEGAIENNLKDFAIAKCIGETHEDAISWLESYHERWLLVLDNADDRSLVTRIRQYIPGGRRGKIIITTRLTDMVVLAKGTGSVFHLSGMNQEDGLALLIKTAYMEGQALSDTDRDAAIALLEDFGFLALAIVHAGAYIRHVHSISIAKYRVLFLSSRQKMLEQSGKLHSNFDDYGKGVNTTWKLCYDLLEEPSKQMLWLMAFLNYNQIHEDLFKRAARNIRFYKHADKARTDLTLAGRYCLKKLLYIFLDSEGHWDTVRFSDVMRDLTSCSLVDFDQMNLAYSVHVLVQDWIRTVIPQTPELALERAAALLSTSMFGLQDDAESFVFEQQLWLHINNIIERKYEFGAGHRFGFADICLRMGQWEQAE
ncbi:hypothetical protein OPQ81_005479 [Rhizoctonia solani]|nr:hypothetical protein OPQ81_005479 [Rhizoctonia solani]